MDKYGLRSVGLAPPRDVALALHAARSGVELAQSSIVDSFFAAPAPCF